MDATSISVLFDDWDGIWNTTVLVAYVCVMAAAIYIRPKGMKLNNHLTRKDIVFSGALLALGIVLLGLGLASGMFDVSPRFNLLGSLLALGYIFLIVAPAEEIIFRGIIQSHFVRWWGKGAGIVAASAVFGLAHLPNGATGADVLSWNWELALVASAGGLLFGWAYSRTKSIIEPIILHASLSGILFVLFQ